MRTSFAHSPARNITFAGDPDYQLACAQGKQRRYLSAGELRRRLANDTHVLLDVGAGDGRFVRQMALSHPGWYAIGVDLCRDNLRDTSRADRHAPDNALYLIADALALPEALANCATQITINFPWGSLLTGLLEGHAGLLAGLARSAQRPDATIEVRLNLEALAGASGASGANAGHAEACAAQIRRHLRAAGFEMARPRPLDAAALKDCPTTWAHRLAFGRNPHAILLAGTWEGGGE